MKKIFLILMMLVSAQVANAYDYSQMCPMPPYPVSNPVARFVSNATGANFLLSQAVEAQIQKELKKELNTKFKVKIKPYGFKNFTDGKFKTMEITARNIVYGGLSISDFKAKTLCDFNQVVLKNKEIYFPYNLVYKYSGVITSEDFSKTVLSKEYLDVLNKMNVTIANKVIFKIFDPTAKIENNRLKMTYKVMTPLSFLTDVSTVNLNAGLTVENEKIVFTEIDLGSDNSKLNLSKMLPLMNRLNPLTYEFNMTKSSKGIAKVSNIKISGNKILVDGVFIVPKNYANKSK